MCPLSYEGSEHAHTGVVVGKHKTSPWIWMPTWEKKATFALGTEGKGPKAMA